VKKDVLKELPDKVRKIVYLSGDRIDDQLVALKKVREACEEAEKKGDKKLQKTSIMTYFNDTGMLLF
jgi:hypothetical protein